MARTRLLDSWHRSRRERTRMPWGRRVASMEAQLGADMTPGRHARWERLDLDPAQPEQDTEPEVEVDEHQADHQHETDHQHEQEGEQPEGEPELEDDEVEP